MQLIVNRDGSIIVMVPLEKRAWHAGISYAKVQVNSVIKNYRS
ncbi:hypothetical protein [Wolbachia endosymbiont of Wuchereria bancrofti]